MVLKPIKCICLQTKITGLHSYIMSHCTVLYDVNITIWPLDRSIIEEIYKGVFHDDVNSQHPLFVNNSNNNH